MHGEAMATRGDRVVAHGNWFATRCDPVATHGSPRATHGDSLATLGRSMAIDGDLADTVPGQKMPDSRWRCGNSCPVLRKDRRWQFLIGGVGLFLANTVRSGEAASGRVPRRPWKSFRAREAEWVLRGSGVGFFDSGFRFLRKWFFVAPEKSGAWHRGC